MSSSFYRIKRTQPHDRRSANKNGDEVDYGPLAAYCSELDMFKENLGTTIYQMATLGPATIRRKEEYMN